MLNSGTGELGYVEMEKGEFQPIAFCPGFLRGLAFSSNYAIVGLSKARDNSFTGLKLQEKLEKKDISPRCGVMIIDLTTGAVVEWLNFTGVVSELYDIQVLPGVQQPMALGFQTDEINLLLTLEAMQDLF